MNCDRSVFRRTARDSAPRRRDAAAVLAVAIIGLFALLASACSTGDSSSDGSQSGDSVVVSHSRGDTTITGTPERIVTLGTQWLDTAQVFDVIPVGYVDNVALATGGTPGPWEGAELAGSTAIDARGDVLEQVAALQPDLILAPGFATDQTTYDQLSAIAPTIADIGDAQVQSWEELVTIMGRILGQEDRAQQVIGDVGGRIDALAAKYPGLRGKTFASIYLYSPSQLMVLADPNDGASALFTRLGMSLPSELVDMAGTAGRVSLSPERVSELTPDLLVATTGPGLESNLADLPGYGSLPAVQTNAVALLDLPAATGINIPSPLSLPYVLDQLEPALAAASG